MRNLTKLAAVAATLASIATRSASAAPIEWTTASGGNGHFYDFVSTPSQLWTSARAAALAQSHNGQQGYLLTLTSAAEQAFFIGQFGTVDGWIGASDVDVEGEWRWMDGPEAGQQFWQGLANGTAIGYASWNVGEPNDTGNFEDYAHFQGGAWNDYFNSVARNHYLVEFNAASTQPPVTGVPEPITLSLLGAGLAGIGLARRRRG